MHYDRPAKLMPQRGKILALYRRFETCVATPSCIACLISVYLLPFVASVVLAQETSKTETKCDAATPGTQFDMRCDLLHRHVDRFRYLLPFGLICLFLGTAVIVYCARLQAPTEKWYVNRLRLMAAVLVGLWLIGPPTWFLLEYNWLWQGTSADNLPGAEHFEYSKELAWKYWLPAVATLVALAIGKLPGQR